MSFHRWKGYFANCVPSGVVTLFDNWSYPVGNITAAASDSFYQSVGSPSYGQFIGGDITLQPPSGATTYPGCWKYMGTIKNFYSTSGAGYVTNFLQNAWNSPDCATCYLGTPPPPPPPHASIAIGPCINPITGIKYQIGDTGPGGGIIFSIPGQGNNSTNHYFEVAPVDVSTTQRAQISGLACGDSHNAIPGAEFGVYKEFIASSNNGGLIGDGFNNTIHLNSYPTSFLYSTLGGATPNPTNPVLDIHDLAAKLCTNYLGPNGHKDWFLPSLHEMIALASNLGPASTFNNIANLSTSTSNPASAFYWTSTALAGPPGTILDTVAGGVNAVTGSAQLISRCTTGSVRPVRMFECPTPQPSVPVVPCSGCSCVDYNYRDGGCNTRGGLLSFSGGHNYIFYNGQEQTDSVIGGPDFWLWTAAEDVVGNTYNFSQMTDDSIGYTITIWDKDYTYLGKWHYSTLVPHWTSGSGFYCAPQVDTNKFHLQGVTHLDGPHAVVNYSNSNTQVGGFQYGSVTHSFWKIECAATVAAGGGTVITDIGCNQTCWGNAPLACCSVSYAPYGCYYFTNPNYPQPACGNQPSPGSGSCWGTPSGYVCQPTYQTNTYPLPSGISNVFTTGTTGQQHGPCYASNGQISNECCGGASFGPSSSESMSNLNTGIPKDIVELSIVTSAGENVPFTIGNWVKSEDAINITADIFTATYNELRDVGAGVETITTHSDGEITVVSIPPLPEEGRLKLEKQVNALIKSPGPQRELRLIPCDCLTPHFGTGPTAVHPDPYTGQGPGAWWDLPQCGAPVGQGYAHQGFPWGTGYGLTVNGQSPQVGDIVDMVGLASTQGFWRYPGYPGPGIPWSGGSTMWGVVEVIGYEPCDPMTNHPTHPWPCDVPYGECAGFPPTTLAGGVYPTGYIGAQPAISPHSPGQPCTQTLSCADGYIWSSTLCDCVPIILTPTK